MLDPLHYGLACASGGLVGFSLGLVGGGGSILAVPLMVYLVRVPSPHVAIGTSALAVAANAAVGLAGHARAGTVKWRCGGMYAAAGVAGALAGSTVGKLIDGTRLLTLFALVMIVVGVLMLRRRRGQGTPGAQCNRDNAPKVLGFGLGTGVFSGFFGIGGGFLIVPGLIASTDMPMINAVGTSLVAVTAFGVTTAANYALSGLVDWVLAAVFIAGGLAGSAGGGAVGGDGSSEPDLRRPDLRRGRLRPVEKFLATRRLIEKNWALISISMAYHNPPKLIFVTALRLPYPFHCGHQSR